MLGYPPFCIGIGAGLSGARTTPPAWAPVSVGTPLSGESIPSLNPRCPFDPISTVVAKGSRLVLRFGPLVVPSCVYRPFNPQCVSSSGDAAFATNAPKLRYQHREQPDVTRREPSETRSLRNCSPHSDTLASATVLLNNATRASATDSGSKPCAPSKYREENVKRARLRASDRENGYLVDPASSICSSQRLSHARLSTS